MRWHGRARVADESIHLEQQAQQLARALAEHEQLLLTTASWLRRHGELNEAAHADAQAVSLRRQAAAIRRLRQRERRAAG
jgi:hypothetical protein